MIPYIAYLAQISVALHVVRQCRVALALVRQVHQQREVLAGDREGGGPGLVARR